MFFITVAFVRSVVSTGPGDKITNTELHKKTDSMSMSREIRNRRLRWLGHVLRMPNVRIPQAGCYEMDSIWKKLRERSGPKTTWRRTVMKELEEMGLTWGEAQTKVRCRVGWRNIITAL